MSGAFLVNDVRDIRDSVVYAPSFLKNRVFIIDGRVPHAILIEMLTNEGIGTMFVAGQGGKTDEHSAT